MWRPKKRRGVAAQLDPAIQRRFKTSAAEIRMRGRRLAEEAMEIGHILSEVRGRIPHGQWLPWLKAEFAWGAKTAEKLIRVHERFSKFEPGSNLVALQVNLSTLYLLSRKSTPDSAVQEAVEQAKKQGITLTEAQKLVREALPATESEPPRGVVVHLNKPEPEPLRTTKFTVESETTTVHAPVFKRTPPPIASWDDLKAELQAIVDAVERIEVPRLGRNQALEDRAMIMHAIGSLQAIRDEVDAQVRSEDGDVAPAS
jgi:hypothetical protein